MKFENEEARDRFARASGEPSGPKNPRGAANPDAGKTLKWELSRRVAAGAAVASGIGPL